jgi:Ca2+-binding EF-hand superfamily protein
VINPQQTEKKKEGDGKDSEAGQNQDDYTSDGGGSIAGNTDRNRNRERRAPAKPKLGQKFKIDRKGKGPFAEYFATEVCGRGGRLTREKLKAFLAKRYKEALAGRITSLMGQYFGSYGQQTIGLDAYADGLEALFGQDEEALRKFAFKIYDANQDKKLSESDMF